MKNLNDLAKLVCKYEGLKESLSIAQVKEVLSILTKLEFNAFVECETGPCELIGEAVEKKLDKEAAKASKPRKKRK